MPVECREYWDRLRTSNPIKFNPAYHSQIDDGSGRYMVVQCDLVDTAVHHGPESHARQTVCDILRGRPALTLDSEREYLTGILKPSNIGGRHTDGATYIMFLLSTKFENLEEERQLNS
eukprot:7432107-Pyramimonas_sp.AAC.1